MGGVGREAWKGRLSHSSGSLECGCCRKGIWVNVDSGKEFWGERGVEDVGASEEVSLEKPELEGDC